jgi:nucleoside 2-deoxyribosyltransferase
MPTPRARVYLAGPMFSTGDKYEQTELDAALKKKYDVHLPQRDGVEVASVMGLLNNPGLHGTLMLESLVINRMVVWVTRIVEALDVYQSVEGCQCVVLNLDGRVPDEGALVEATLAWSVGVPVVPFKTTPITELGINDNPMVNAICGWVPPWSTPADVVTAVDAAVKSPSSVDRDCMASGVQLLSQLGRAIWQIRRRRNWTPPDVQRAVAELQALPVAARNLIEAVPLLQPFALELVVTIIEFSRLKPGDPRQQTIVQQLISDSKRWNKQRGVRQAIINSRVTA